MEFEERLVPKAGLDDLIVSETVLEKLHLQYMTKPDIARTELHLLELLLQHSNFSLVAVMTPP